MAKAKKTNLKAQANAKAKKTGKSAKVVAAKPTSRRQRPEMEERAHPRAAPTVLRTAVEQDGRQREGYLMNVSLGGGFLVLSDPPEPQDRAELHLVLPWGLGECRLEARSIWRQTDEKNRPIGAGIEFENLAEDERSKLRGYLERFEALAAEITA